jgi:hypothetical protein
MQPENALYLSIPAPCEQSWNDMQPALGGRHCNSCSKTIVDFSLPVVEPLTPQKKRKKRFLFF